MLQHLLGMSWDGPRDDPAYAHGQIYGRPPLFHYVLVGLFLVSLLLFLGIVVLVVASL